MATITTTWACKDQTTRQVDWLGTDQTESSGKRCPDCRTTPATADGNQHHSFHRPAASTDRRNRCECASGQFGGVCTCDFS